MSATRTTRRNAGPPGRVEEETEPMMPNPEMAGKFREEGKKASKAEYVRGWQFWLQFAIDIADKLFSLIILIGAIWQMTDLTNPDFPYKTWEIVVVIRMTVSITLAIWWSVTELLNTRARDRDATELPCPERISSLAYYWVVAVWWIVATGFYAKFYADHTANDTASQDASFEIKLVIIMFAAYTDMFNYVAWLCRIPLDQILLRSGSKCLGC